VSRARRRAHELLQRLAAGREAHDPQPRAPAPRDGEQRRNQPGVLEVGGDDLVALAPVDAPHDAVHAVGRARGDRNVLRVGREQPGDLGAEPGAFFLQHRYLGEARAPLAKHDREPLPDRLDGAAGERAGASGVEVCVMREGRELRADRIVGRWHARDASGLPYAAVCIRAGAAV